MVLVFCWYSYHRLMHPEGRHEHRLCVGRYSHVSDLATIHFIVGPCHFQYHAYDLEQAPDRAERVLGVGLRRNPVCSGPV
jgi:hypothetical protein